MTRPTWFSASPFPTNLNQTKSCLTLFLITRGWSRTLLTFGMDFFVTLVNGWLAFDQYRKEFNFECCGGPSYASEYYYITDTQQFINADVVIWWLVFAGGINNEYKNNGKRCYKSKGNLSLKKFNEMFVWKDTKHRLGNLEENPKTSITRTWCFKVLILNI